MRDYYISILGRTPSDEEVSYWTNEVEQRGNDTFAIKTVLEIFINSHEYRMRLLNLLPFLEPLEDGQKLKVAIWGVNEESKLICLLFMYLSEWENIDVNCFIDENGLGDLHGVPIKKISELNETVDRIVLSSNISATDKIFDLDEFDIIQLKLVKFNVRECFILLPDLENGRLDSKQWDSLLGKDTIMYSDGSIEKQTLSLIEELNKIFSYALGKSIIISGIIQKEDQSTFVPERDKKILIAQNFYSDALTRLFEFGISSQNIVIIKYTGKQIRLEEFYMQDTDVLVYSMNKVGSTSFAQSLLSCGIKSIKLHFITPTPYIADYEKHNIVSPIDRKLRFNRELFINTIYVNNYLSKWLHHKKIYVITGVRAPLERLLSLFFHNLDGLCKLGLRTLPEDSDEIIPEVITFVKNLHRSAGDWFLNEMKPNLHFDVYRYPFDCTKGYQIIDTKNIRLLNIRLENLNDVWEEAVKEWLGEERLSGVPIALQRANDSSEKKISDLYKQVKSTIEFDSSFVEEIYSTKYAKHFYSDEELHQFKKKWTR